MWLRWLCGLRALAALAEDPDFVPSTHMVAQRPATPVPRGLMTSSREEHTCGKGIEYHNSPKQANPTRILIKPVMPRVARVAQDSCDKGSGHCSYI